MIGLDVVWFDRHVLAAHSEKAAHVDHGEIYFAVTVQDKVLHLTDLAIVEIVDAAPNHFAGAHLIGLNDLLPLLGCCRMCRLSGKGDWASSRVGQPMLWRVSSSTLSLLLKNASSMHHHAPARIPAGGLSSFLNMNEPARVPGKGRPLCDSAAPFYHIHGRGCATGGILLCCPPLRCQGRNRVTHSGPGRAGHRHSRPVHILLGWVNGWLGISVEPRDRQSKKTSAARGPVHCLKRKSCFRRRIFASYFVAVPIDLLRLGDPDKTAEIKKILLGGPARGTLGLHQDLRLRVLVDVLWSSYAAAVRSIPPRSTFPLTPKFCG